MKTNTTIDVRQAREQELARLRPIAAELEKLPEMRAAAAAAQQAHSAFFNDPKRSTANDDDNRRLRDLNGDMSRTSEALRNVESAGRDAEREIRVIERSLGAAADVERIAVEIKPLADAGASLEKQLRALADLEAGTETELAQAKEVAASQSMEAARREVAALLENKPLAQTKTGGTASDTVPRLTMRIAAVRQQRAEANAKLIEVSQRAEGLSAALLKAKARVAELDFLQAIENIRPLIEHYCALSHVPIDENGLSIPVNQVAVRELSAQIAAEHRAWQPTMRVGKIAAAPEQAHEPGAIEGADSGAQVAA